jgi:hypothetical protein
MPGFFGLFAQISSLLPVKKEAKPSCNQRVFWIFAFSVYHGGIVTLGGAEDRLPWAVMRSPFRAK